MLDKVRMPDPTITAAEALMAELLAGRDVSLEFSSTLPPSAYTSEPFFQLEVDRVFRPGWLCVAHVSQLRTPGDFLRLDLLDEKLIVVNDRGTVRTLSAACAHRWTTVVEGSGNARHFICPLHNWRYATDGRLIAAPFMGQARNFDPSTCRLHPFATEVVDGFVYVNLDGNAPALAPRLDEMTAQTRNARFSELEIAKSFEYVCKSNWKIVVEVFMECYHHMAVHRDSLQREYPTRESWTEDSREAWTVGHCRPNPAIDPAASESALPKLPYTEEGEISTMRLYLVYPFQLLTLLPDSLNWFRLQPEGAGSTRIVNSILLPRQTLQAPDFPRRMAELETFWSRINQEDFAIHELQQAGATSRYAVRGRQSHLEKSTWQLANHIRERLCA